MIVFNGSPQREDIWANRAFLYGDGVFETIRISGGRVLFLEDHYFRLMASMRILRMEIPMLFTMEFIEEQVLLAASVNDCREGARVRFTVFRKGDGRYFPLSREVDWHISAEPKPSGPYQISNQQYEADLFRDFHVPAHLLSTLKTTNRLVNITAGIFASENGLDNCLLVNESKNVVEAINGNIFLMIGGQLITPPLSEGCLNGIMRKQVLLSVRKANTIEVVERAVSPFEIQKADELWITNVIAGIIPVTRYRKKEYLNATASGTLAQINNLEGLN